MCKLWFSPLFSPHHRLPSNTSLFLHKKKNCTKNHWGPFHSMYLLPTFELEFWMFSNTQVVKSLNDATTEFRVLSPQVTFTSSPISYPQPGPCLHWGKHLVEHFSVRYTTFPVSSPRELSLVSCRHLELWSCHFLSFHLYLWHVFLVC